MRPLLLALALLALAAPLLAGCATFDEVEGVPDALSYSYFQGSPAQVVDATRRVLSLEGYTLESINEQGGGVTLIRVTTRPPGADFSEIRIEPTAVRDFRARAQTSPRGRRLPIELERRITAEL